VKPFKWIAGRSEKIQAIHASFRKLPETRQREQGLTALERFNEATGPVFKIKNDPWVTFLGRFLRKTSIDELPQLFRCSRET